VATAGVTGAIVRLVNAVNASQFYVLPVNLSAPTTTSRNYGVNYTIDVQTWKSDMALLALANKPLNITIVSGGIEKVVGKLFVDILPPVVNLNTSSVGGFYLDSGNVEIGVDTAKWINISMSDNSGVAGVFLVFSMQKPTKSNPSTAATLTLSGSLWTVELTKSNQVLPQAVRGWLQAGKQPVIIKVEILSWDAFFNYKNLDESTTLGTFNITIVDKSVPSVDVKGINSLTDSPIAPHVEKLIYVSAPVLGGESGVRRIILFYAPSAPTSAPRASAVPTALTAWKAMTGVKNVTFARISEDKWMGVLPGQEDGETLVWAVYIEDYAGNNNGESLNIGNGKPIQVSFDQTTETQVVGGYIFLGIIGFGMILSIAYRVQQGVTSVKKAKKISAAVKKAPGKKTIGTEPSKKMPISKDIETIMCPICKAKIGADSTECPYCHKKF
jgi:hypothetical protein